MPYIYQVSFDIPMEQRERLGLKSEIDRTVSYLHSLLPEYPGYLTSSAMYSLHLPRVVRVLFQSVWARWDDLEGHRRSAMEESKVFSHWAHVDPRDIAIGIYAEVGTD